jgi:hypothetical protein
VTAEFEAAEKHYQKAIDDLQTHRQQGHRRARSAGRAGAAEEPDGDRPGDYESRDALQVAAVEASAQSGLFDALRTKVALLQQTVELINEMRKGNQAEAGRASRRCRNDDMRHLIPGSLRSGVHRAALAGFGRVTLRGIVPEDGPRTGWLERYTQAREGP